MSGRAGKGESGLLVLSFLFGSVLAVLWLHHLGTVSWLRVDWREPLHWLATTPATNALAASLRTLGLVAAYWLAGSTALSISAAFLRARPLQRLANLTALPLVRRASERLVAGSLAISSLTVSLPAQAVDQPPPPPVAEGYLPFELSTSLQPDQSEDPPELSIRLDATLEVVVKPGDHLWGLAERRIGQVLGRRAMDHEVAPYWVQVIGANQERLQSGDPDLIYPGEVIFLPPVDH